ncbi:unnamed protein product, partial [Brenthis ino]
MPFGKIETFEVGSHNWDAYCRRIKQFITLNDISEHLHVATLVTHVGVSCYELMCDLCSPDLPEDKTFDELVDIVKNHLEPQRSEIAERHIFRQRKQLQGETVSDYLQSLKHLAKTCNFRDTLEINIRDQFVSGLINEDMRSRLFAERDIDYKRAIELALALEAADRHAAEAASGASNGVAEGLHNVRMKRIVGVTASRDAAGGASGAAASDGGGARRACSRCGRAGHGPARCRFKQYTCDNCGQKGHLKVVCQNYKSVSNSEYQKHHKALMGHRLRGRLDLLRPSTRDVVLDKQQAQQARHGGVVRDMSPGDRVLVRNYNDSLVKWKEGVVVEKRGPVSYVVKTDSDDRISKRHVDQLLKKNVRFSRYSLPTSSCTQPSSPYKADSLINTSSTSIFQSPLSDKNSSELNNDNRKAQSPPLYPTEPSHSQSLKPQPEKYVSHGMTLRPRKKYYYA